MTIPHSAGLKLLKSDAAEVGTDAPPVFAADTDAEAEPET